ncbi:MAG: SPOR domain-containing protein [Novosphingobium sp.]
MNSKRTTPKKIGYVAIGAMAVATLGACAGSAHLARADIPNERGAAHLKRGVEKNVVAAERAVARTPQNASLRAALGLAYLQVGRFTSATTAFDDAMRLGDNSPRTALSLALAKVGAGHGREAVAILDDWRDTIPASDLGLALALAGETTRGAAILTDALRAGQSTAKLRQNLAYAYALDGRWREARTMMEQDIPADQVDRRISEWAMQGRPEDAQKRVAGLLGAPIRSDPGLPQSLAMGNSDTVEQLAAEATAVQPQPVTQPVAAHEELPAAGVAVANVPVNVPHVSAASEVAAAPAEDAPVYTAAVLSTAPASESVAVVQPVPTNRFANAFVTATVPAPVSAANGSVPGKAPRTVRVVLPAARPLTFHNGSHLIQLGSFSSPQGARRGWGILASRNPRLRDYRMVITPAVVNGKNFWRVAAAGFDAGSAWNMCSTVRNRGGACFAYAATRAPAGALPGTAQTFSGPQFARRK